MSKERFIELANSNPRLINLQFKLPKPDYQCVFDLASREHLSMDACLRGLVLLALEDIRKDECPIEEVAD